MASKTKKYVTVLTVAQAAVRRGIHNPHQLHLKTGISVPRVTKLWNGEPNAKIELEDINKLCENIPCRISDLFERVPVVPAG